jgi:organic hydroperoxide reductase OsmC/OhrA
MRIYEVVTSLKWQGDLHGRAGVEGKEPLFVAAPPEFQGPNGVWNPEDLFVQALESCLMLTFVSLCVSEGIELCSYSSKASGRLEKTEQGLAFGWVVITPVIEARAPHSKLMELIRRAHELSMIRRSVSCQVAIYPEIAGYDSETPVATSSFAE